MSAGFTPGPWTYGVRDDGSIWQSRGNPMEGPHYQDDFFGTEADARLIAAAPELYEALESIAFAYHALHVTHDVDPEQSLALRTARAALAKARGEQVQA